MVDKRTVTLTHVAGGKTERTAWADLFGIWVNWGLAGNYMVTKSPGSKSFRHLKASGEGAGWVVDSRDFGFLLSEHREIVAKAKKAKRDQ
jgi:hypothetical protein